MSSVLLGVRVLLWTTLIKLLTYYLIRTSMGRDWGYGSMASKIKKKKERSFSFNTP